MNTKVLLTFFAGVLLATALMFQFQTVQATPSNILEGKSAAFLNALRRERVPVAIYLVNGIKIQGQIESFDNVDRVIFLKNSVSQMIFMHAVSTVVPARNVSLEEEIAE